ncbi:hypothetical protein Taro_030825 [Colocasia esculenta]|uniref:Uncharacterized protein n=1 Tax=Colocasia esculenta TaxID=4460 RepID=A0A843VX84_COLES|nr:hypothetical protein [Colocasia esculenta]
MLGAKAHTIPLCLFGLTSLARARVRAAATLPDGIPDSSSDPPEGAQKKRGSPQLNRWLRARTLRSGRKLERRSDGDKERMASASPLPISSTGSSPAAGALVAVESEDDELPGEKVWGGGGKVIFMVSDGTGWTAEHSVSAALGQFEHCLVDRGCPVNTHLFSGIEDLDHLMEIIRQAAMERALLLYTLADPSMADAAKKACKLWGVPFSDILGPITEAIATHLGVAPSGIPRSVSARNMPLSEEYFRRIEAIDFTIKQDDGAQPQNLSRAHIVLLGVSRTGKTPLSIYLAQKGYKVANVPLVLGAQPPKTLFEINQEKIYALTINPVVLQTVRKTRAKSLGFSSEMERNYSDRDHVREELEFAKVTGKAIEETAAVILRTVHDRKHKHTMPRISRRY